MGARRRARSGRRPAIARPRTEARRRRARAVPGAIAAALAAVDAPGKTGCQTVTSKIICSNMVNAALRLGRKPPAGVPLRRIPRIAANLGDMAPAAAGHRPARYEGEWRPGADAASHFGRSFSRFIC